MNRRLLPVALFALVGAGCASTRVVTNPASTFPLDASDARPAFLFPVNLSHLGSGGDPLTMGAVVTGGVANQFGKQVISGQQLFDLVGNLSFELAEAIQTEVRAGKWVLDGPATPIADELARKMEAMIKKLVELKLLDRPVSFKYLIAIHSHGSSTMSGSILTVDTWGGVYDLETKTITDYLETRDNFANKPEAVLAGLPSTYNGIIAKLLLGSAEPPKEDPKK